eukprot:gene9184-11796_t
MGQHYNAMLSMSKGLNVFNVKRASILHSGAPLSPEAVKKMEKVEFVSYFPEDAEEEPDGQKANPFDAERPVSVLNDMAISVRRPTSPKRSTALRDFRAEDPSIQWLDLLDTSYNCYRLSHAKFLIDIASAEAKVQSGGRVRGSKSPNELEEANQSKQVVAAHLTKAVINRFNLDACQPQESLVLACVEFDQYIYVIEALLLYNIWLSVEQ